MDDAFLVKGGGLTKVGRDELVKAVGITVVVCFVSYFWCSKCKIPWKSLLFCLLFKRKMWRKEIYHQKMRMQLSNLFKLLSICVILNWLLIPFLLFQYIDFITIKAVYKEPNRRPLWTHIRCCADCEDVGAVELQMSLTSHGECLWNIHLSSCVNAACVNDSRWTFIYLLEVFCVF